MELRGVGDDDDLHVAQAHACAFTSAATATAASKFSRQVGSPSPLKAMSFSRLQFSRRGGETFFLPDLPADGLGQHGLQFAAAGCRQVHLVRRGGGMRRSIWQ